MTGKDNRMYNVPEGYFEGLNDRLSKIPFETVKESRVIDTWQKTRPFFALAASIAVLVVCGTTILKLTTKSTAADESEFYQYACNMIPETEPYALYDESLAESLAPQVDESDIMDYLIDSGVSLEQIYENEE